MTAPPAMTATTCLARYPAGIPITADQITEFHAARILLLLHLCGVKNRIAGLTKLAKVDFFVRYPDFFERAARHLEKKAEPTPVYAVESAMIRHHYGPWDARYYQLLAYLEGRELIAVERDEKTFLFTLTDTGLAVAKRLAGEPSYKDLGTHMKAVKKLLGSKSGDVLKKLVYELFDEEVAKLPLGQVIQP
jgi:DNA-binding PadR family transcriptional regulator